MDENRNITQEELSELLSERKDPARQIAILEAGLANANAEVTALRARVAELEAEARWVSVEQGLPEGNSPSYAIYESEHQWLEMCLCRYIWEQGDGEIIYDTATYDHDRSLWFITIDGQTERVKVTHWKHMPPEAE